jgi:hypothetical protein
VSVRRRRASHDHHVLDTGRNHQPPDVRRPRLADDPADVLGVHRWRARVHLFVVCDDRILHSGQPLQRLPQFRVRRNHGPRHDGGHHNRRHRPVGRIRPGAHRNGRRHDDGGGVVAVDRPPRRPRCGSSCRRHQRRSDRLSRDGAVRRHARHDVACPKSCHGDVEQHHGLPVRPGPREVHRHRRRLDAELVQRARLMGRPG